MAFWTKNAVPSNGLTATPCCAHTSAEIDKNLYIFGGWTGSKMINDLFILHTPTMRWSKPQTGGTCGQPRAGHSMTAVGHKLFVFGGANDGVFFNDLQIFDTDAMTWVQAYVTGTNPAARSRHTANVLPAGLILPPFPSSPNNSKNGSPAPTPRRNSLTETSKKRNSFNLPNLMVNYILIFGGGDDRRLYNDLYALNTDSLQWIRLEAKGTPPSPRWGHTASLVDKKLYVFGGHDGTNRLNDLHVLNLDINSSDMLEWSQPTLSADSTIPPARAGHTADVIGKKLFIYGGGDGKVLSDLYYFDIDLLTWSRMNGTSPGRCAHSSTAIDGKLYIFGGGNGTKCFKDMYIFDADSYIKAEEAKLSRLKNKLKVMQKLESFIEQKAKTVQQRKLEEDSPQAENETGYERLTTWLSTIGMSKYLPSFIAEEIDMDIIHLVTEDHLKKLNIESISARLVIMAAIDKIKKIRGNSGEDVKPAVKKFQEQLRDVTKALHTSVVALNVAALNMSSTLT